MWGNVGSGMEVEPCSGCDGVGEDRRKGIWAELFPKMVVSSEMVIVVLIRLLLFRLAVLVTIWLDRRLG